MIICCIFFHFICSSNHLFICYSNIVFSVHADIVDRTHNNSHRCIYWYSQSNHCQACIWWILITYANGRRISRQLLLFVLHDGQLAITTRSTISIRMEVLPHYLFENEGSSSDFLLQVFFPVPAFISTCSNSSSAIFLSIPPAYPVRLPFVPTTR